MGRQKDRQIGFSVVVILLVVVVVGVAVATGLFLYQRQKSSPSSAATNTTQPSNQHQIATDVYAGWQTYCDRVYHYCFKYPQGWSLSANTAAKLGDTGGASLANPAKTLAVTYVNAYTQDSGIRGFMPASLDKLTTANQDLTIVGGYIPTSGDNGIAGNNVPTYRVVDTSLLATYPLTVGAERQFPNNPRFTDQATGSVSFTGKFEAKPAVRINSLDETHAWFTSSDVKTSLLILKSFQYQPNS